MLIASRLYEDGTLSYGQVTKLAGLTKRIFIKLLGKYNVLVFSTSVDDLGSGIANIWFSNSGYERIYKKYQKLIKKNNE